MLTFNADARQVRRIDSETVVHNLKKRDRSCRCELKPNERCVIDGCNDAIKRALHSLGVRETKGQQGHDKVYPLPLLRERIHRFLDRLSAAVFQTSTLWSVQTSVWLSSWTLY